MTFSLADLDRDTALVRPFEGVDLAGLPSSELVELLRLATAGRRSFDVIVASIAGEVARRSAPDAGPGGLARHQGFASPEQFVASVMGASHSEGVKLVSAGVSLSKNGPVGDGLRAGGLSVDKADLVAQTISRLEGDTRELEVRLVRAARSLDFRKLKLLCAREAARFDAVQLEGRERRQHDARELDLSEDAFGMTHVRGQLDPVSAGVGGVPLCGGVFGLRAGQLVLIMRQ